ncbi:hypothetical protein H8A95_37740 [Bradyrhizobium sp. Pear76]|uniref:hypothetical protein n=1 Tax=Bradyrhizobium oropedii TaxID=1571201 RepID=UPI001E4C579F|nr:hypothetical protein [Bradyrhizobium oropedii]MCC8967903.1 hypothetical protein [Bradyrhizobium oropedii]
MAHRKDDWEKTRSNGGRLTEAEIGQLRASFRAGVSARDAARSLKCSTRTVNKHFARFSGDGPGRGVTAPPAAPPPSPPKSRFYKSTFEL